MPEHEHAAEVPPPAATASAAGGGCASPDDASAGKSSHWRGAARITAIFSNSTMILYIYLAHLVELEWDHFGRFRPIEAGHSDKLSDYLRRLDLDPAFEHLRRFTFSEAMLNYLNLYLLVGVPVAVVLAYLELDRVRWLQALAVERLPAPEASRASRWLELYLWALTSTLAFIIAIGFFHIGLPRAHYICAGCAITSGCVSMSIYLLAPLDYRALAQSGSDPAFLAWNLRVRHWVRPSVKAVLMLHVMAVAAGAWKAQSLGDDNKALLFGIVETAVIVGYQVFQGVMVVDDLMIGRRATAKAPAGAPDCVASRKDEMEAPWNSVRSSLLGS